MNRSDPEYLMACDKAALGLWVICHDGPERGLTTRQMTDDMDTVVTLLANGVGLPNDLVAEDVLAAFNGLPGNEYKEFGDEEPVEVTYQ